MRNSVSDLTNERDAARIAYLEKKYRAAAKRYIYERVEYYIEQTVTFKAVLS